LSQTDNHASIPPLRMKPKQMV